LVIPLPQSVLHCGSRLKFEPSDTGAMCATLLLNVLYFAADGNTTVRERLARRGLAMCVELEASPILAIPIAFLRYRT
jgi:hypothetical protein